MNILQKIESYNLTPEDISFLTGNRIEASRIKHWIEEFHESDELVILEMAIDRLETAINDADGVAYTNTKMIGIIEKSKITNSIIVVYQNIVVVNSPPGHKVVVESSPMYSNEGYNDFNIGGWEYFRYRSHMHKFTGNPNFATHILIYGVEVPIKNFMS